MLSYQHGYHAGNFADVVKHLTLTRLIQYLITKDKPLFYLETHSGKGLYDLKDSQALKTGEYLQGINLLWEQKSKLSKLSSPYLSLLKELNPTNELRYYPGSPLIAISQLREIDRLFCCELHPREFEVLQKLPKKNKRVFFSHSDGIDNLHSQLPPKERRGLIFIDPSFEIKQEYKTVPQAIKKAYARFSTGIYCLWYPIIDAYLHEQLLRNLRSITKDSFGIEFHLTKEPIPGMTSCGLWIINPPYTLKEEMNEILKNLTQIFNPNQSSFTIIN